MEASEEIDVILRDFDEGLDEESFAVASRGPTLRLEEPGQEIGPYTLREQIGEGAFGTVWRAEQAAPLRREVVLKILKPGMDSREIVARFARERQALAAMDHPGVARVLDAGLTPSGRPFFAMELVRGTSITSYCARHALGLRQRLELVLQVCQAIRHAHLNGIVHRDIKPSNVLVVEGDPPVAKVIDFGIAKAIAEDQVSDMTLLTREDRFMGTPAYMSPEQVGGAVGLDARTDVYSLGALLYELIAGCPPLLVRGGARHR